MLNNEDTAPPASAPPRLTRSDHHFLKTDQRSITRPAKGNKLSARLMLSDLMRLRARVSSILTAHGREPVEPWSSTQIAVAKELAGVGKWYGETWVSLPKTSTIAGWLGLGRTAVHHALNGRAWTTQGETVQTPGLIRGAGSDWWLVESEMLWDQKTNNRQPSVYWTTIERMEELESRLYLATGSHYKDGSYWRSQVHNVNMGRVHIVNLYRESPNLMESPAYRPTYPEHEAPECGGTEREMEPGSDLPLVDPVGPSSKPDVDMSVLAFGSNTAPTWDRRARDLWDERFGAGSSAVLAWRLPNRLRPLVKHHGAELVLSAFGRYLDPTVNPDSQWLSVETFARKFGMWLPPAPKAPPMTAVERQRLLIEKEEREEREAEERARAAA